MGKNLKGKEIGKGICQIKDGLYSARFLDSTGKRQEKYFKTLPEARNWLEDAKYAGGTIRQAYITMGAMFRAALMNDMIAKHPMNGVRYTKPVRAVDDIHFLTIDEQKKFLEHAQRSQNYRQYVLILETGLRTG